MIAWMAAEAESEGGRSAARGVAESTNKSQNRHISQKRGDAGRPVISDLPAHQISGSRSESQNLRFGQNQPEVEHASNSGSVEGNVGHAAARAGHPQDIEPAQGTNEDWEQERERRIYRARTVTMLRRYMRYSIETGRLPSLLGREFFRTQVTSYTVVTFEDRVIFVHDMEMCLSRLDEFSQQIIARHVLQEHDQAATGRLLHCAERTVRTYIPIALDLLTEILIEVGLLERMESKPEKSCQEGKSAAIGVSDCGQSKNKNDYVLDVGRLLRYSREYELAHGIQRLPNRRCRP